MVNKPRKPRIIRETVKDLHTSHWDLDMLSRSDLESLMGAVRESPASDAEAAGSSDESPQFDTSSIAQKPDTSNRE